MCNKTRRGWLWCAAVCLLVSASGCQNFGWTGFGEMFKPKKQQPFDPFAETHGWTADPTDQQKIGVQMAVALSMERQGKTDEALGIYRDVIAKDKRQTTAYHRLAVLHEKQGDAASALKYYREALQCDPKNAEVQCDYGYCCYLRRDWKTGETSLRKAVELQPGLARAHNNLGLLLARTGREDEALQEFFKAGCAEPAARANLALALTIERRFPEAEQQYQRALAADPNLKPAQEGLAALRTMRERSLSVDKPPSFNQAVTPASYLGPAAVR